MRLFHLIVAGFCAGLAPASASAQTAAAEELVYKTITPCRAFDTRRTEPVRSGGSVTFLIAGTFDMRAQGGPAKGCGVPFHATAVQLALTTRDTTKAGYALAYPAEQPQPQGFGTVYAGIVMASATSVTPLGGPGVGYGRVTVFSTKRAHVIGDVTGYYAPKIEATLDREGKVTSATSRITGGLRQDLGFYRVFLDVDPSACRAVAQPTNSSVIAGVVILGSGANIATKDVLSGQAVDSGFHLLVSC